MSAADAAALTTPALSAPATASPATSSSATSTGAQQVPAPPAGSVEWAAGPMYQAGLLELLGLGPAPEVLPPIALPAAIPLGLTEVTFLQDGVEYFAAIEEELNRVEGAAHGYVHLAYWQAWSLTRITDPYDTTLPDLVLEDRLRDVASWPDHTVRVLLWAPQAPASWFAHNAQEALAFQTALDGDASGRIAVRLEPFGAVHESQHQKIAIFSGDGEVHAVVGGLNMSEWYWDDPFHDGSYTSSGNFATCHDTGVLLNGAATAAVEAEFLRRWMRVDVAAPPMAPTPPSAVTTGSIVDVKLTDGTRAKRDIQSTLVQRIARAEYYVYLENYAIFDSALVDALAARMRDVPDLSVVLNIPNPKSFGPPNGYLHRLTFLELALQVCDTVEATLGAATQTLTRADALAWDVVQPFGVGSKAHMDLDPWLEQSYLSCALPTTHHMVPFSAITAVHGPFRMYSPVRAGPPVAPSSTNTAQPVYIHSKLALVDDDTAAIGSANFNYRSMLYDGELTAFVVGDVDARAIRTRLFSEWHVSDPYTWPATADANLAALFAGSATVGQLHVLPLTLADFPSDVPDMAGQLAEQTDAGLPPSPDWLPQGARDLITAGVGVVGAPLVGLDSRTFH